MVQPVLERPDPIALQDDAVSRADRATLPRAWAATRNFDPNLPIRGRYVSLWLAGLPAGRVKFAAVDNRLVSWTDPAGATPESLAYFIPEHAADPTRLKPGEELWVEVSVPSNGMPRPLRLGVRRNGGAVQPLDSPPN